MSNAGGTSPYISHLTRLVDNAREVARLLEIHEELTGSGPGRRAGVEVLNKSGLVLLVACWEAFVEDLVLNAVDVLVSSAAVPDLIPGTVRAGVAKSLEAVSDDTAAWRLADDGWRHEVKARAKREVDRLNTPSAANLDRLFERSLGLRRLTSSWSWKGMSADQARKKLSELINRRGRVAHRVATAKSVRKKDVESQTDFIYRLAIKCHNRVGQFLKKQTAATGWPTAAYSGKWRTSAP